MQILYLARWFPFPADNGAKIRTAALLRALATAHSVELVAFVEKPPTSAELADARAICTDVTVIPYKAFAPQSLRARLAFFSPKPRSVVSTWNPSFAAAVQQSIAKRPPQVVIAGEIDMAPYAQAVQGIPRVFEELELGLRMASASGEGAGLRDSLSLWKLRRYVRTTLADFAACTVVSAHEEALMRTVAPDYGGRVAVIPNGVTLEPLTETGPPVPNRLLFTGAVTYSANLDAVRYFADKILPLIQAERPDVTLRVTGRTNGVALGDLAQKVEFTGYLDAVEPLLHASWAVVVPLREGGGTRLKILAALAAGTPVVSTTKGADGLDLTPERDLLIADGPAAFAAATLRLLDDPALRATLAANGRAAVTRYDWAKIGPRFCALVEEVAQPQRQDATVTSMREVTT
jgi:hypothetical protein